MVVMGGGVEVVCVFCCCRWCELRACADAAAGGVRCVCVALCCCCCERACACPMLLIPTTLLT